MTQAAKAGNAGTGREKKAFRGLLRCRAISRNAGAGKKDNGKAEKLDFFNRRLLSEELQLSLQTILRLITTAKKLRQFLNYLYTNMRFFVYQTA